MRKKIDRPLVLTVDEAFQPAACVLLTSVFLGSCDVEFTTYLITDSSNDRLVRAVETLSDTFKRDIKIAMVGAKAVADFATSLGPLPMPLHISIANFLRIAVHELLPFDSFVYLDSDMVAQGSLRPLFELDLGNHLLAAATDGKDLSGPRRRLKFRDDEPYTNAGTLVVNARAWREAGGVKRVREVVKEPGLEFRLGCQDTINLFCRGRTLILERKWNTLQHYFFYNGWSTFDAEAFRGVFHFASQVKPWMAWAPEPARRIYGRYAALSPWRMPEIDTPRDRSDQTGVDMLAEAARVRGART